MSNLYNKIYNSVKETTPQFKNSEEALSFYLTGAAKYLAKAELAAKEDRIEDRSKSSDNAMLIFSGILSHLDQFPTEEKKSLKSLAEYCLIINELIIRMNMKNDVESAANLSKEVRRMAEHWKQKSDQVFENAKASSDSNAAPHPTTSGQSSSDFSA